VCVCARICTCTCEHDYLSEHRFCD